MTQKTNTYENLTIKKLDKSEVEITAHIPVEAWEKFRAQALENINETAKMDGFRKGKIPEDVLIGKVGEMPILEEMAELALTKAYVDILVDNKIDAIGRPRVSVTKLAKGVPVEFKAVTAVVPEIKLGDYKKISTEENAKDTSTEEIVTEKDIEDATLKIRKSRVSHDDHDHEKITPEEHEKMIADNMPELTDEFVKSLGEFSSVDDFKKKVAELLVAEKKDAAKEKRRIRTADALIDASTIELPEMMIESEVDRMQAQFEGDIERMNVKIEDYLKHSKKTVADIRAEWKPAAERKAKLQHILNEIATAEKLTPTKEEIMTEVDHIVSHYKDADIERAEVYAETVLTNEKVFEWLERNK